MLSSHILLLYKRCSFLITQHKPVASFVACTHGNTMFYGSTIIFPSVTSNLSLISTPSAGQQCVYSTDISFCVRVILIQN